MPEDKKPGRKAVRVADLEERTPPVDGIGELGEALLRAAFAGVSAADMTAVLESQVQKAKGGDTKAARFVTDFALASVRAARPVPAPPPPPATVPPLVLRQLCARVVAAQGPTPLPALTAICGVPEAEVALALAGPWFELPALGPVSLTPTGRREAGL